MISDDQLKELDKEVDEYLCHRRFFNLSMKFGESSSVTCEPNKAHWLVSKYHNYELKYQDWFNTFPEAFEKFQQVCKEALSEVNSEYRNPIEKKGPMTEIRFKPRTVTEQ